MKFKVVEYSRFLRKKDMETCKGGINCLPDAGYQNCNVNHYLSCKVEAAAVDMFNSHYCGGTTIYTSCSGSMTYRNCSLRTDHYTVCSGEYHGK